MAAASATIDMSQVPAGTPPAGVTPNLYGNPPSLQSTIIGFAALFYILTTIAVSLRLYSVARSLQKIAADDGKHSQPWRIPCTASSCLSI